jgi:hypothetical protein
MIFCDVTPYSPVEFHRLLQKYTASYIRVQDMLGKQLVRKRLKVQRPNLDELLQYTD